MSTITTFYDECYEPVITCPYFLFVFKRHGLFVRLWVIYSGATSHKTWILTKSERTGSIQLTISPRYIRNVKDNNATLAHVPLQSFYIFPSLIQLFLTIKTHYLHIKQLGVNIEQLPVEWMIDKRSLAKLINIHRKHKIKIKIWIRSTIDGK